MLSLGRLEYWGTVQASHSQFAEMTFVELLMYALSKLS